MAPTPGNPTTKVLVCVTGVACALLVVTAAGILMFTPEDEPFPLPMRTERDPLTRFPAAPRDLSAESLRSRLFPAPDPKVARERLIEIQKERLRERAKPQAQQQTGVQRVMGEFGRAEPISMYWAGKRSDDPASNPKVIAYLKERGVPLRYAEAYFQYQWQIDSLDELEEPPPALPPPAPR